MADLRSDSEVYPFSEAASAVAVAQEPHQCSASSEEVAQAQSHHHSRMI